MRLLVLGGTAWLGGEIVAAAIASGHEVTCLARGESGRVPAGARFVSADRDKPDAYADVVPPTSGPRPNVEDASPGTTTPASEPRPRIEDASPIANPPTSEPQPERWDAVIDLSRSLDQVRAAVDALEPHADAYLFVSSTSAYASQAERNADEDAATFPDPDPATPAADVPYGVAKAAAERAVLAAFGADRSTIIRPGLIGGPGDLTGRSTYWPTRFARAAEGAIPADGQAPARSHLPVLVPAVPELPTALIDVRDLASFIVSAVERAIRGIFNASNPSIPFSEHLALARQVTNHEGPVIEVDERWLLDAGVAPWAGPRSIPLWIDDRDWWGMNDRDVSRALAAGMRLRPLAETLAAIVSAERGAAGSRQTGPDADGPAAATGQTRAAVSTGARAGLSDAAEEHLISAWHAR
jgi:2'-hydroxyisoflavone reductase